MRGAAHLAIHVTRLGEERRPAIILAVPGHVAEADRATLLETLADGLEIRFAGRALRFGAPDLGSALPFWEGPSGLMGTEVPMVLDAPGTPRRAPWTLDDAVICSVGYAMRGVLEPEGLAWEGGWAFRRALVTDLRERGVDARARRVLSGAARFSHRAREGDLLVAVDAIVRLGELGTGEGLLALGRSRHLGGGLLRPLLHTAR
jgi:CRISPR-associated protein Csb2